MPTTTSQRFWSKVRESGDCWVWTGSHSPNGYGRFWDGSKVRRAHRWAYEAMVAPIPDGLDLDHLCRTRDCVNPFHLEPVTHRENLARGIGSTPGVLTSKVTCPAGHLYDEANTYWHNGWRHCRSCRAQRKKAAA